MMSTLVQTEEETSEFEEELQETMGSESRPSCADSLMRCLQCPLLVWQSLLVDGDGIYIAQIRPWKLARSIDVCNYCRMLLQSKGTDLAGG